MFLLEIIIATACARGNHRRCRFCRDYYRHCRIDVALYERMCLLLLVNKARLAITFASCGIIAV